MKKLRVAVLSGGVSPEREVSLASGKVVVNALEMLGHDVVGIDVDVDLAVNLQRISPDLVYNALHGGYGEDGSIAGMLDVLGIPYTHSGVLASSIGMNKVATKRVLSYLGIDYPAFKVVTKGELLSGAGIMPYPFVVKPVSGGSTIGVYGVFSVSDYRNLLDGADVLGASMVVEEYVEGKEVQTAVFLDKAIGTMEFVFNGRIYGYDAKYTPGLCEHIFPARLPEDVYEKTMQHALALHRCLGCKTMSRVDFRYDDQSRKLKLLEVNTHPGMSACSAFSEIVKLGCGIELHELVDLVVKDALGCDRDLIDEKV